MIVLSRTRSSLQFRYLRRISPPLHKGGTGGVLLCAVAALLTGCGPGGYKITPIPVDQTLDESVIMKDEGFGGEKIVLIDVDGVIMNSRGFSLFGSNEHPVSLLLEKLDKAANDKQVRALILRINSPGGSVTASDLMHSEIKHWKKRTGGDKPVIAVMMDLAASGGYYIACACDEIVAHPTTVTGSIGVIMQMINVEGTMNKIGLSSDAIKSGNMKDAGSPFRKMKAEERELFQSLVNQFYDRFVDVVAEGRPNLDEAKVRELADGRVYSADTALELGFVDRIGTLRSTVNQLKEQLGAEKVRVVTYHRPLGWKPNVYAEQPTGAPQTNLINVEMPDRWPAPQPQFMYLWSPGL